MQTQGEKIKKIIKARGWQQKDFAAELGYDPTAFSKLLKEEPVNNKALGRIAKGLGVTVEFLLSLEDVGNGKMPDMVNEPNAPYLRPSDREAQLAKENEILKEELEMIRQRLVAEKMLNADLAARLEAELKAK